MNHDDQASWPHDGLVAWARQIHRSTNDVDLPAAVVVRATPWSTVVRWELDDARLWGKSMCPGFASECAVLPLLAVVAADKVVAPIAADRDRGWLLLPDGGETLNGRNDLQTWTAVVLSYAELQQATVGRDEDILGSGCPDMRPKAAAARLEAMMTDGHVGDHPELMRNVCRAAEQLDNSRVPATIQHDDLRPDNVFEDHRVFDWGDACLAHPFASLLTALMPNRPDRPGTPSQKADLRDAYLRSWQAALGNRSPSLDELRLEADLAIKLAPIARIDTWLRAPEAALALYPDAIDRWVEHLLETTWP